jgi:hypothetical protein
VAARPPPPEGRPVDLPARGLADRRWTTGAARLPVPVGASLGRWRIVGEDRQIGEETREKSG